MNINALPDLCLRIIFNHLPLTDFITLNQVCQLWDDIQKSIAINQQTLTICIGKNANEIQNENPYLKFNENNFDLNRTNKTLQFDDQLSDETTSDLLETFKNIRALEIAIGHQCASPSFVQIIILLTKWKLIALKLFISLDQSHFREYRQNVTNFFHTLNEIQSLKQLTLEFHRQSYRYIYWKNPRFDLPIIRQLEEFNFSTLGSDKPIIDSIQKYALKNPNLKRFKISNCIQLDTLVNLLRIDQEFSSRLTHLSLSYDYDSQIEQTIRLFNSTEFTLLNSLEIYVNSIQIHRFIKSLASKKSFSKLTQLRLRVDLSETQTSMPQTQEFVKLESIKTLSLELNLNSHHDLYHNFSLDWIFPNVSTGRVNLTLNCACEILKSTNQEDNLDCWAKMLAPLKRWKEKRNVEIDCGQLNFYGWAFDDLFIKI